MIITAWASFLFLRRASGRSLKSGRFPVINVFETEVESVLEYWLQKIEQEAGRFFKQKLGSKKETQNKIPGIPSLDQVLATSVPKLLSLESTEDQRPPQVEQKASETFKQKSEEKTESKKETKNEIQGFPSPAPVLVVTRPKPESLEKIEDKRPPKVEQDSGETFKQKSEEKTESKKETKNETQGFPFPTPVLSVTRPKPESLEKIEDKRPPKEVVEIFKQKSESKIEIKEETNNKIQGFPSLGPVLTVARRKPESLESIEDRRPPRVEVEEAKIFMQNLESETESKMETINPLRGFPSLGPDLAAARSKPESWESFEDRRPHRQIFHMSYTRLTPSSSEELFEERINLQLRRWSHTRVYRVTSDMKKDVMEERLDRLTKSISRVMFQAKSETDIQVSDSE